MRNLYRIHDLTTERKNLTEKFLAAFPVILFFIFLFFTVICFFGTRCIMVVSCATVLFKVNYKKRRPWSRLFVIVGLQMFLCVLAYVASWSVPLRILLDIAVPFCLIIFTTNQFNKLACFTELMAFVFLQLMPLDFHGFFLQAMAFLYSLCCVLAGVAVYRIGHPGKTDYNREKQGLMICAQWLNDHICREEELEAASPLYRLSQTLYQDAFMRRGGKEIVNIEGKVNYIFALLFQRVAYFADNGQKIRWSKDSNIRSGEKEYVRKCIRYLERAGSCNFWEKRYRQELDSEGRKLLREGEEANTELCVSMQNFIRPFLIILVTLGQYEEGCGVSGWKLPSHRKLLKRIRWNIRIDTFEFRFAMRMSLVLTLTFLYAMISRERHAYWLPLNAFLLLRPMYEESKYRLKTRFAGTVWGCAVMAVIYPVLQGYAGHLIFAVIMAVGMYTVTPGTKAHAVFVTCFGLSMATLAMGEISAIELRLVYVASAVAVVLVVNRFFFPTSMQQQFRFNVQQIFYMHHGYLRLLRKSLVSYIDYGIICDAQIQYHMIHGQTKEYINKGSMEDGNLSGRLLEISWRMVSEMEQLLFLINTKKRGIVTGKTMENYIDLSEYILDQIRQRLRLKRGGEVCSVCSMEYHRTVPREPELSYLLTEYSKNMSEIYRLVCKMCGDRQRKSR